MKDQPNILFNNSWFIDGKPATRDEVEEILKQYIEIVGDGDND
jgi:hypothetical protein